MKVDPAVRIPGIWLPAGHPDPPLSQASCSGQMSGAAVALADRNQDNDHFDIKDLMHQAAMAGAA